MAALRLAALVVLAAMVSGCALAGTVAGPRSWTASASNVDGRESVVSVTDRSGRVQDVEFDPLDAVAGGGVVVVPGQPSSLDVPWTGGSCDKWTAIDIVGAGAGLGVTVTITPDETLVCDAMGVLKTIRIKLDQPIPPGLVVVRQEPGA
jgi:hypothetical protein